MTPRRNDLVLVGSRDHLIRLGLLYVEQRLDWLARREDLRSQAERTERRPQLQSECGR